MYTHPSDNIEAAIQDQGLYRELYFVFSTLQASKTPSTLRYWPMSLNLTLLYDTWSQLGHMVPWMVMYTFKWLKITKETLLCYLGESWDCKCPLEFSQKVFCCACVCVLGVWGEVGGGVGEEGLERKGWEGMHGWVYPHPLHSSVW